MSRTAEAARKACLQRLIEEGDGIVRWEAFMQAALYDPSAGFYTTAPDVLGAGGHFTTVPEKTRLLAQVVADWCKQQSPRHWIELGCGTGLFHRQVLRALNPWMITGAWCSSMVEISPRLKAQQRKCLGLAGFRTSFDSTVQNALARSDGRALLFGNEFIDAFPCIRLQKVGGEWKEWGIDFRCRPWKSNWFPLSDRAAKALEADPPEPVAPEGMIIERIPAFGEWLSELAQHWNSGSLLLIDYGFETQHPPTAPQAPRGSLRAYHRHQRLSDEAALIQNFGRQDLTFDVDFQSVHRLASAAGLQATPSETLRHWLSRFPKRTQSLARDLPDLLDPEAAGGAFRVIQIQKA